MLSTNLAAFRETFTAGFLNWFVGATTLHIFGPHLPSSPFAHLSASFAFFFWQPFFSSFLFLGGPLLGIFSELFICFLLGTSKKTAPRVSLTNKHDPPNIDIAPGRLRLCNRRLKVQGHNSWEVTVGSSPIVGPTK